MDRAIKAAVMSPFVGQRIGAFLAKPNRADLRFLTDLIEADKLRPAIDRAYSLSEVPDAIRYLEDGHVRGKVLITV